MRTYLLKHRRFACCCIFSLILPWGCLFGEGETAAQMVPIEVLVGRFKEVEGKGAEYDKKNPRSKNWGGYSQYACQIVNTIGRRGDRAALSFLEEKSLMTNTPPDVRSAAALAYVKIATAEECAAFLPKILKMDDEDKTIISWRNRVTPACLEKIEDAFAKQELRKETLDRLIDAFVMYTQSAYYSTEATMIDNFLLKHCEGYQTSKQRLLLTTKILDADKGNELKRRVWLPIKESVEAIPSRKRVDLRDRFPGLPPLPEDKNAGMPLKVALMTGAACVVLVVVCVALRMRMKRREKAGNNEKE